MMLTKIVHVLKKSRGFLSGEELSRRLKISRAGVWKHMEELRAAGYEIDALPHRGYKLISTPDILSPGEIAFDLGTKILGGRIHYFDVIDSTMTEAFRRATDNAPEGTLVVADTQTKGRGRMGRFWSSPGGKGIYCSLILRPACPPSEIARLTLVAAVAVSEAVEKATGLRPLIKWPNDLLLNGKKVCGILTELRAEIDRVQFVIVGIGINVNTTAHLPLGATSFKAEAGIIFSRVRVLQEVLRAFERRYLEVSKQGFAPVLQEWKQRSATLGRKVRFEEHGKFIEGVAADLAEDGGLLVRLADGRIVKRMAGEILL